MKMIVPVLYSIVWGVVSIQIFNGSEETILEFQRFPDRKGATV